MTKPNVRRCACAPQPAELAFVDQLVERRIITPQSVAEAGDGEPAASLAPHLLHTLTLRGAATARAVIVAATEEHGVVDYFEAGGFRLLPRVLRRFAMDRALAFRALPTVSLDRDKGPIIVVTSQTPCPDLAAVLERELGSPVVLLHAHPDDTERAIRTAYEALEQRSRQDVRLTEILVRDGIVEQEELDEALDMAHQQRNRVGEALIAIGALTEEQLYEQLARRHGLRLVRAVEVLDLLDRELALQLPLNFCRHERALPYRRDAGSVRVATCNPQIEVRTLAQALGVDAVRIDLIPAADFDMLMRQVRHYRDTPEEDDVPLAERVILQPVDADERPAAPIDASSGDRFVSLADELLLDAIQRGASDIHLEIYDQEVVCRVRVDGVLHDTRRVILSPADLRGVLNVFKIRSNLDISERRQPQGGRMRRRTPQGALFDFRVQTQPALHGEHLVIRLLSQSEPIRPLDELGFVPHHREALERILANPSGLVLVTGPTGCGKTTTLYALLDRLRRSTELKIVTIEDPIEYGLARVQQSQVNRPVGYDFAQAVRSFLREDPDVVLVGETRDPETAIETIRASQTGHLVFSTLHTNDAVDAIRRLLDLGVTPASAASELLAVLSQRLGRRVCNACRAPYAPDPEALAELFAPAPVPEISFTRGRGCARCSGTGYRGRVALVEVWLLTSELKELIHRGASGIELRRVAMATGLGSMVSDAREKVRAGVITVEEARRVLPYSKFKAEQEAEQQLLASAPAPASAAPTRPAAVAPAGASGAAHAGSTGAEPDACEAAAAATLRPGAGGSATASAAQLLRLAQSSRDSFALLAGADALLAEAIAASKASDAERLA